MKQEFYTVHGYDAKDGGRVTFKVLALYHRQHWSETNLQGVSRSGIARLKKMEKQGMDLKVEIDGREIRLAGYCK